MNRRMVNGARFIAGAMALAFAVVSSATCLAAALDTPRLSQHACCAAMTDCGGAATVINDCCAATPPVTGVARIGSFTLAPPAAADHVLPAPAAASLGRPVFCDPDISYPVSPPAYLLDSVFRI